MNFRIKSLIFLVLICFSFPSCMSGQQKLDASLLKRVIGVWPYSENSLSFEERKFSWGIGKYLPNDSIIIDYSDDKKSVLVTNPGLGDFIVESIVEKENDVIEIFITKKDPEDLNVLPLHGSFILKFIDANSVRIDDTNYGELVIFFV